MLVLSEHHLRNCKTRENREFKVQSRSTNFHSMNESLWELKGGNNRNTFNEINVLGEGGKEPWHLEPGTGAWQRPDF